MKLYGIACIFNWHALCFGTKAWCFKLMWSKKHKRFYWLSYWTISNEVWWNRVNSYPFKFIGIMVLPNNEIHDL